MSVTYGPGSVRVTENGQSQLFPLAAITGNQLYFWGGDGNDTFVNSTGVRATAFGMGGNDVLFGRSLGQTPSARGRWSRERSCSDRRRGATTRSSASRATMSSWAR